MLGEFRFTFKSNEQTAINHDDYQQCSDREHSDQIHSIYTEFGLKPKLSEFINLGIGATILENSANNLIHSPELREEVISDLKKLAIFLTLLDRIVEIGELENIPFLVDRIIGEFPEIIDVSLLDDAVNAMKKEQMIMQQGQESSFENYKAISSISTCFPLIVKFFSNKVGLEILNEDMEYINDISFLFRLLSDKSQRLKDIILNQQNVYLIYPEQSSEEENRLLNINDSFQNHDSLVFKFVNQVLSSMNSVSSNGTFKLILELSQMYTKYYLKKGTWSS